MIMSALSLTACAVSNTNSLPDLPDYSQYIELCNYTGIPYTLDKDYTVSDEDVQSAVENALASAVTYSEITDRGAQKDDTVTITYKGTIDGETFSGGSSSENGTVLYLGHAGYVSGFEDGIVGMKTGETRVITVTFPEDHANTSLRGKSAEFTVCLKQIRKGVLPEITDELVKEYTDYATVDELRTNAEAYLIEKTESEKNEVIFDQLMDYIIKNSEYKAYPDGIIDDLANFTIEAVVRYAESDGRQDDIDAYIKENYGDNSFDEFKEKVCKQAESYMNIRMTLCEIARRENITVDPNEFVTYQNKIMSSNGFTNEIDLHNFYDPENLLIDCVQPHVETWLIKHAIESPKEN